MQMPSVGSVVWIEISASDLERAKGFYGELFGWKFEDVGSEDYVLLKAPNVEGMFNRVPKPGGYSTVVYLSVEHLMPSYERALGLGASAVIPPRPIPGKGSFAVVTDTEGNRLGLFSGEAALA